MRKLFIDTEFTGLHQSTTLISLALVAETNEEFYAEFTDFDLTGMQDWISENVIPNLFLTEKDQNLKDLKKLYIKGTKEEIKQELKTWIAQFGNKKNSIQIWGDVPAYDWVLFCQLFGGALNIPGEIHYICGDIATLFMAKGLDKDISRVDFVKEMLKDEKDNRHNALFDAKVTRLCFQKLNAGNV